MSVLLRHCLESKEIKNRNGRDDNRRRRSRLILPDMQIRLKGRFHCVAVVVVFLVDVVVVVVVTVVVIDLLLLPSRPLGLSFYHCFYLAISVLFCPFSTQLRLSPSPTSSSSSSHLLYHMSLSLSLSSLSPIFSPFLWRADD